MGEGVHGRAAKKQKQEKARAAGVQTPNDHIAYGMRREKEFEVEVEVQVEAASGACCAYYYCSNVG